MSVLRRERSTLTQLIPRHIRQVLARIYTGEGQTLGSNELLGAVESHSGFMVTVVEPPQRLVIQGREAAILRQNVGSAESRVEALISNIENFFLQPP